jgi:DNA-binding transcriptional MerR regulator
MKLKRSEALHKASVSERELRLLEQEGMVTPTRSWKTLWMVPYYDRSQVDVIQWLATCQRNVRTFREKERRQVVTDHSC